MSEQQPLVPELDIATTSQLAGQVLDEVDRAVVGKRSELALM